MMNDRVNAVLSRIESWLEEHMPEAIDQLGFPATDEELDRLEEVLGWKLPEDVRALYSVYNGDRGDRGLLGGITSFLSTRQVAEQWLHMKELALELNGPDDVPCFWRKRVEEGSLFIKGPVKPWIYSEKWIPIFTMNGDVFHFLDFDPAPGGTPGQVVEVDLEMSMFQVVADSLVEFLEMHAETLETGGHVVVDGWIELSDAYGQDALEWGVPEYLRHVELEYFEPGMRSDNPDVRSLEPGKEVVIVGRMGAMFGDIFMLTTEQGSEYSVLGLPGVTKGYNAIRVGQYARVTAERYGRQLVGQLVESPFVGTPDLLARSYRMLVDPKERK